MLVTFAFCGFREVERRADGLVVFEGDPERIQDLVILRGRNHYPHDLELTAESAHPALAAGASAAFAVEAGEGERLVLACEVGRREAAALAEALAGVAEAVREAVFREHEARVHDLVLLPPGAVPRTSSGKIRRGACRAAYLARELEGRRLRPGDSREVPPTSLSDEVPPSSWWHGKATPAHDVEETLRNQAGEVSRSLGKEHSEERCRSRSAGGTASEESAPRTPIHVRICRVR